MVSESGKRMIGMIAWSGIVTRDSIILVDFIHLSLARKLSVFAAIMASRVALPHCRGCR